jgi:hypothetical protein
VPPPELLQWERILQSPVAVALLLLAAIGAINGIYLSAIRVLWRENKEKDRALREFLAAQSDFEATVRRIRTLTRLQRRNDGNAPD